MGDRQQTDQYSYVIKITPDWFSCLVVLQTCWEVVIYPSSVTFRVFWIKGLKEKTLEGKRDNGCRITNTETLGKRRPPNSCDSEALPPEGRIVDEYCGQYKDLFKEVRNYEYFKYLHLGMILPIKRKSLPEIAKVVSINSAYAFLKVERRY
jgi:hypothetical protein